MERLPPLHAYVFGRPSDPDLKRKTYFCIPRRCNLCLFPVQHGDSIVARSSSQSGNHVSLTYTQDLRHFDHAQDVGFAACWKPFCTHECPPAGIITRAAAAVVSHAECHRLVPWSFETRDLGDALRQDYEPFSFEDRRRRTRIRWLLARRLWDRYGRLPLELWVLVAAHLSRECAAVTLEPRPVKRDLTEVVDVSEGMRVTYTFLDGVRYVSSLSNATGVNEAGVASKLYSPERMCRADALFILKDHLGIRQVVPAGPEDHPRLPGFEDAQPGAFWRTFELQGKTFATSSDGVKLREVCASTEAVMVSKWAEASSRVRDMAWSAPRSRSELNRVPDSIRPNRVDRSAVYNVRMTSIVCNEPTVTGYSVCVYRGRVLTLHAHRGGVDAAFYRACEAEAQTVPGEEPAWFYLPINPGEVLKDIWFCSRTHYHRSTLAFSTNHGRFLVIGRYDPNTRPEQETWSQLQLPKSPTRIHFSESPRGVHWLTIREQSMRSVHGGPPLPAPQTPQTPRKPAHYSEADLEDVTHLTPCRDSTGGEITGVLLRYSDGRQACVGSFRLDRVGTPLDVRGASVLHLGHGRSEGRKESFVVWIELAVPEGGGDGLEWRAVPLEGKLEWFTPWAGAWDSSGARPRR